MKSYKLLAGILSLLLFFSVSVMAQEEEKEMTEEEFQTEMNRLTEQRVELTKEMNELKSSIDELKKKQAAMQSVEDCINEKYALVGATEADVARYRREVAQLEGQIQRKESPKDDRQVALDNLKASKLSALPEFNNNFASNYKVCWMHGKKLLKKLTIQLLKVIIFGRLLRRANFMATDLHGQ